MLEMNYYVIEKELLNLNEVAVRDLLITGPKGSIHIDTKNITMIPDTYEAVENNNLGLNLDVLFEIEVKQLDDYFYELIINNKKMEECKMNFKYLKKGEAQVIINNLKGGKIKNNCICLNNTDTILLRTNGSVIYGEYKEGDHRVKFTHSPQYALPYIASTDYGKYKEVVLSEWKKAYTPEAQAKMREVRMLVAHVINSRKEGQASETKKSEAAAPTAQDPVLNKETKIEEKKEEVKDMNKTIDTTGLTTMGLAHLIRRELKLEGHYHVQMKIAMKYAWAIKKGQTTIEELLNITTSATEATAPTYNAANKTVEETAVTTAKEPKAEITTTKEPKKETKKVTVTTGLTIYLEKLEGGVAYFYKAANGMTAPFFKFRARNIKDMDKQFAREWMAKMLQALPNDSVVYYYGDYTQMTYLNNEAIRLLADSKNIRFEQGLYGVAPSGIA